MSVLMPVLVDTPHMNSMGDGMQYDATYHSKRGGKGVTHIVAPPPMPEEEKERRVHDFHLAAWSAWNHLSVEERLRINAEYEALKAD